MKTRKLFTNTFSTSVLVFCYDKKSLRIKIKDIRFNSWFVILQKIVANLLRKEQLDPTDQSTDTYRGNVFDKVARSNSKIYDPHKSPKFL